MRSRTRLTALSVLALSLSVAHPAPVSAHPLGNATVNHYDGLHLYPDRITVSAVEDVAEIPTFQRRRDIDRNGDSSLSPTELGAYATSRCALLVRSLALSVDSRHLSLHVVGTRYVERAGAIGLTAGRLDCSLEATADLSRAASVSFEDSWDGQGIGWHEVTAVGTGVSLKASPFPATSISQELRRYPGDLLSSPLDVRRGTVGVQPGSAASTYEVARGLPVAGAAVRALNRLTNAFNSAASAKHLTVGVGLLSLLLALLLGAGHAFLPGHGKTIMAAYLVGRRGRLRDVVTVGATVTLTHTLGVLVLGLAITTTTAFAPTQAEQYLGVLSGLIVAGVGVGLLVGAIRRRHRPVLATALHVTSPVEQVVSDLHLEGDGAPVPAARALAVTVAAQEPGAPVTGTLLRPAPGGPDEPHDHDGHDHAGLHDDHDGHDHAGQHDDHATHGHGHGHDHEHEHEHGHDHGHGREHDHGAAASHRHGFGRAHSHAPPEGGFSRGGLIGLGIAGGLVPSPSALLVLLAATALGRTAFGVVLVLGYGLGMAAALSVAGLLLVKVRGRLDRFAGSSRLRRADRLLAALPVLTALLVLAVGIGLSLRALGGAV